MTNTLLDFSQRPKLALHARVVADVEAAAAAMGIAPLIAGAFARDLHLLHRHGITMQRKTEDIDFALTVPSLDDYVWQRPEGTVRGTGLQPLHPSVPYAAVQDARLYEMLALFDALRVGRARERVMAARRLPELIHPSVPTQNEEASRG